MIKFVNKEGRVVMTESDQGNLEIIDEELKQDFKKSYQVQNEPDKDEEEPHDDER